MDPKRNRNLIGSILILLGVALTAAGCTKSTAPEEKDQAAAAPAPAAVMSVAKEPKTASGEIYLYGEQHGVEKILEKEFEVWRDHYEKDGMRHLFVEYPNYTAEFLNLWMKSDDDEILEAVYDDWDGTLAHNPYIKPFFKKIKSECPETVFHGTDVGHQYETTGERYIKYLEENGKQDSEELKAAQNAIEQGRYYYENSDDLYRENKMAENFIFEFDQLNGQSIMGIYGSEHIRTDAMDDGGTVLYMTGQLKKIYGERLHTEDLSWAAKITDPVRIDTITLNGKDYEASYFGKEDLTGFKDFASREFWRLENAYEDFKDAPVNGDQLPSSNYPMVIEASQVFVIDYTMTDGSVMRLTYRSDGELWNGRPSTQGIIIE